MSAPESVLSVPIASVEVGLRIRPVDQAWAEALSRFIAADGQLTPIEVCRLPGRQLWTLVSGAHRLEAARLLGWQTIRAVEVSNDAQERRVREVSENLLRRDLTPIDRSAFVGELYELARARAGGGTPQQLLAKARWGRQNRKAAKIEGDNASAILAQAYDLTADAVERVGLSRRSVYRDLLLYKGLAPDLKERLRALADGGNAAVLRRLAALPFDQQRDLVAMVEAGTAPSLAQAMGGARQLPASRIEREMDTLIRRAAKWSARDRVHFQRLWLLHFNPRGEMRGADLKPVTRR
ncbi:MAG: ParB N-terminal domain-containing protein [Sphingomonadaceae bacterium]